MESYCLFPLIPIYQSVSATPLFLPLTSIISNNTIWAQFSSSVYFRNVINLVPCESGLFELTTALLTGLSVGLLSLNPRIKSKTSLWGGREVFLLIISWTSDNISKALRSLCFGFIWRLFDFPSLFLSVSLSQEYQCWWPHREKSASCKHFIFFNNLLLKKNCNNSTC